jgi:hypothetical protein
MSAAELAVAMEALVYPRTVIEGPDSYWHDLDDSTPACSQPEELHTEVELTDVVGLSSPTRYGSEGGVQTRARTENPTNR